MATPAIWIFYRCLRDNPLIRRYYYLAAELLGKCNIEINYSCHVGSYSRDTLAHHASRTESAII